MILAFFSSHHKASRKKRKGKEEKRKEKGGEMTPIPLTQLSTVSTSTSNTAGGGDVISPTDKRADLILGLLWGGAAYVMGMLWTVLALIDRWRGRHSTGRIGLFSVVAAFVLAAAWPLVMVAMAVV